MNLLELEKLAGIDLDKPYHFFVSSGGNWNSGVNLQTVLNRQKRVDQQNGLYTFNRCAVWLVPCPADQDYRIVNFAPQVENAVFLFMHEYHAKGKTSK